jgi:ankyrin repeat protein
MFCSIGPCQPLGYLAQARFNGFVQHGKSGELAHILLRAGAPVDGELGGGETPLITAASYRELAVASALISAGANLEATGYAVQGGTALAHAIEFGAPEIVDLLTTAGARRRSIVDAAGAGDLRDMLESVTDDEERASALRAAVLCERLSVIDQLLDTGLDINRLVKGGSALHWAAWEAKAASARHLVARGADSRLRDPQYQSNALGWAEHRFAECPHAHPGGHVDVIRFLSQLDREG